MRMEHSCDTGSHNQLSCTPHYIPHFSMCICHKYESSNHIKNNLTTSKLVSSFLLIAM